MTSLLLIPIIALAAQASSVVNTDNDKACITVDCVQTAAAILNSMDTSVDPCENFYDYACGRWIKEHPIPDHKNEIGVFGLLAEKIVQTQRSALEEPVSDSDFEAIRKAKVFYKSCMDAEEVTDTRRNWLREMIDDLGGWPVLGDEPKVPLEYAMARLQVLANDMLGLMPVLVTSDRKNRYLYVYVPNNKSHKNRKAFHTYMKKVATLLGSDPEQADKDLDEVLRFETRLEKRVNKFFSEVNPNESQNLTLQELQQKVPEFNWTMYLQEVFQTKDDLKQKELRVFLWTIVEMGDLLENTDRRLLQNYIVWNAVNAMGSYMTGEFKKARNAYINAVLGKSESRTVRWRECVSITRDLFQKTLDYLYITRETFNGEEDVHAMFDAIKAAFQESLEEKTWMDEKSRSATKEKTLAVPAYTGYSKEFYNISEMNMQYKEVMMSPQNFIGNVKELHAQWSPQLWRTLKQPVQEEKWGFSAAVVNAAYSPELNIVNIAAGIMKGPFYSSTFPKSMNYGGLGFVLGHELTHSVDSTGRLYDKDGNMVQWWDNTTIEAFENRAQCIIKQYSAFQGDDVNGEQTLGENIADNGSIRVTFKAYRKWVEKHGEEPRLPGMDLSHDQIFFVSTAMGWCRAERPKSALENISTDEHSPARARVIIPMRNSADFAAAFKCPLGSPMNPVDKCILW